MAKVEIYYSDLNEKAGTYSRTAFAQARTWKAGHGETGRQFDDADFIGDPVRRGLEPCMV